MPDRDNIHMRMVCVLMHVVMCFKYNSDWSGSRTPVCHFCGRSNRFVWITMAHRSLSEYNFYLINTLRFTNTSRHLHVSIFKNKDNTFTYIGDIAARLRHATELKVVHIISVVIRWLHFCFPCDLIFSMSNKINRIVIGYRLSVCHPKFKSRLGIDSYKIILFKDVTLICIG